MIHTQTDVRQTTRVDLVPVEEHNALVLWRLMQSGGIREFQDVPRFAREEFRRRIAARPLRIDPNVIGRHEWVVVERAFSEPIGWVSIRIGEHPPGVGEIGYTLVPTWRGRGFALESVVSIIDHVFATSEVRTIEACCVRNNRPSRRLLERVGFDQRKVQRNGAVVGGRPVDVVMYRLDHDAWTRQRGYDSSANSMLMPASANPK